MPNLSPYLTFDSNCREAMQYYQDCPRWRTAVDAGERNPHRGSNAGALQGCHPALKFKTSNFELMGTDMKPEPLKPGNDVHPALVCNSEEEIHSYLKSFLREDAYCSR